MEKERKKKGGQMIYDNDVHIRRNDDVQSLSYIVSG